MAAGQSNPPRPRKASDPAKQDRIFPSSLGLAGIELLNRLTSVSSAGHIETSVLQNVSAKVVRDAIVIHQPMSKRGMQSQSGSFKLGDPSAASGSPAKISSVSADWLIHQWDVGHPSKPALRLLSRQGTRSHRDAGVQ